YNFIQVSCHFEFTNIKCTSLDTTKMDIAACFLRSVNRTYKYLSFRTKVYQFPVTDVTVSVQVLKRLNGYKPFLFNFTADGCKFLKGHRNQMTQFFFNLYAPYSNINHPCPFYHDVYVEKLPISHLNYLLSKVLPVPEGFYLVHSTISTHTSPLAEIKVYMHIY
ncbi:hypothetical protein KR059_005089, partial [Drosophila kikkawai]